MEMLREFVVGEEDAGQRADKFLSSRVEEFSREQLKELFSRGEVLLNGKRVTPSEKLSAGAVLSAVLPQVRQLEILAEEIPLNIVYEDADVAVVDKPQGLVVHPAPGNYSGTMVNGLLQRLDNLSAINGVIRPGIVHRIDKDTSGLLVVAKNDAAHNALAAQFAAHSITRAYEAVVHGTPSHDEGVIDAPIGRDPNNRKAMTVTEKNSKRAVTHYWVLRRYENYSHLRLQLQTGRTHQIRVHMRAIGHPVVGDPLYGRHTSLDAPFAGQLLHAALLGFTHPSTGEYMEFHSELPDYFYRLLKRED